MNQEHLGSDIEKQQMRDRFKFQSPSPKDFLERHKEELENAKINGLGDVIAKVAEKTGIAKIANKIEKYTGKGCGCKKRQETLNKIVPL